MKRMTFITPPELLSQAGALMSWITEGGAGAAAFYGKHAHDEQEQVLHLATLHWSDAYQARLETPADTPDARDAQESLVEGTREAPPTVQPDAIIAVLGEGQPGDTDRNLEAVGLTRLPPVPLNEAGAKLLQTLPNVGPALADAILAAREQKLFTGLADLSARVDGIGETTVETWGMRAFV